MLPVWYVCIKGEINWYSGWKATTAFSKVALLNLHQVNFKLTVWMFHVDCINEIIKRVYRKLSRNFHCVKSVPIRRHSGSYFPEFGLNTMRHVYPYSIRMQENTDQNNSEYGHFLRSDFLLTISPFHAIVYFCTLWKHKKTGRFLMFFKGYRKRPVAWNGLKKSIVAIPSQRNVIIFLEKRN